MNIPVDDLLIKLGKSKIWSTSSPLPSLSQPFQEKVCKQDVSVHLKVQHQGQGRFLVTGEARALFEGLCGRCLDSAEKEVQATINEVFLPDTYKNNISSEQEYRYYSTTAHSLPLDEVISEALLLELPLQLYCKEDCPGLCQYCGEKLTNELHCCKEISSKEEQNVEQSTFQTALEALLDLPWQSKDDVQNKK